MSLDFDQRVMIITGAGGGLGRAYATFLAARGARIVVNDYGGTVHGVPGGPGMAQAVVDEITAAGGQAVASGADVGVDGSGDELVQLALDTWGRLDAVINNAGATRGGVGIADNSIEDLLFSFNIHVAGAARLARAAWPHLLSSDSGRIVNTSSDSIWGTPTSNYVTCKAAVFGLTRALAAEAAAHGSLKVNTVMPSAWTRMTGGIPPGDFRDTVENNFPPEAAAPFVAYLVHPECPWNGEAFQVGANRAAREYLAVTSGFIADQEKPLQSFAEHPEQVTDTSTWVIPGDMLESVELVVADLEGRPRWP
ncbi:SDR family NAD(P)-dependent oxidoreductase [Williamsia soli]|uniref:SDR family NAD(P)-dependent oxidoreductase n=1 Tax=Williamsia soli TaxID=364929 RepID=UPI001A9E2CE5|nr:SDR family NAD(P)-dependent oxidoreductase [Williamsia soli]